MTLNTTNSSKIGDFQRNWIATILLSIVTFVNYSLIAINLLNTVIPPQTLTFVSTAAALIAMVYPNEGPRLTKDSGLPEGGEEAARSVFFFYLLWNHAAWAVFGSLALILIYKPHPKALANPWVLLGIWAMCVLNACAAARAFFAAGIVEIAPGKAFPKWVFRTAIVVNGLFYLLMAVGLTGSRNPLAIVFRPWLPKKQQTNVLKP